MEDCNPTSNLQKGRVREMRKALVIIDIQNDITKNYKDVIGNILCKSDYGVSVLSDCITSYDKRKIGEMLSYYDSKGSKIICLKDLL